MENMDGWSVALVAVAGYLAVMALVRLMIRRRDQMLGEFRRRMRTLNKLKQAEEPNPEQPDSESKAA